MLLILVFLYVLSGQTLLSNDYLMLTLERISKKYGFSETGTGILMAFGMSVPELTTNIFSCYKVQMIGYGFGTIVGSGVFDFSVCFGIMSIFSYYYHGRALKLKINSLMRDIYVYVFTLLYLTLVFWDYQISLIETLILTSLYPLYLIFSIIDLQKREDSTLHVPTLINVNTSSLKDAIDDDLDGAEIGVEEVQQDADSQDTTPKIFLPFKYLFNWTIPSNPELSFIVICTYFFGCVSLSMQVVDQFVEAFQVSPQFVGLTIASWGGNIGDILNSSVAAKHKKTELATSAIIGSQIMNLQICLGLPWLLTVIVQQKSIVFIDEEIFNSVIIDLKQMTAVLIVILASLVSIWLQKFQLTYALGIKLLIIYLVYFIFELYKQ